MVVLVNIPFSPAEKQKHFEIWHEFDSFDISVKYLENLKTRPPKMYKYRTGPSEIENISDLFNRKRADIQEKRNREKRVLLEHKLKCLKERKERLQVWPLIWFSSFLWNIIGLPGG